MEYLDEDDMENIEFFEENMECCEKFDKVDVVVCDNNFVSNDSASPTTTSVTVLSYLYDILLLLLLCPFFLVIILSECVKSLNIVKKKVEKLNKKIQILQTENSNLRCSVKTQTTKYETISTHLKNLEEVIGRIFSSNQLNILKKNLKRPKKWDDETILKALRMKFACSKRGYTNLINDGHPLPSLRILRRRLQGIDFNPGILKDVFSFLKEKVQSFTEHEKECFLVIDEMSIVEGN